ncbi:hypothetical protein O181_023720 [Austropuccinia psidii MF-1]|uniref:Uncharacterized protein n=1 Tax=Austropuccinia psidii MF-1 TaxID=1389203 RepID=A0A9Q3CJM2_9BASI|nr:hypothetical protein [Austropuccinia psidii MF-1]
MVTLLRDLSKVIIQPMKDGNGKRTFELGPIVSMSCHPWDSNAKNKTQEIPHNKTHLFLVCLASKLRGNPLQAQVAPDGWGTYSASPPNTMSHLFQAQVNPLNQMRTLRLVSLNLRWLQHNQWRNLLVSTFFYFFLVPKFPSPLLQPSPACPATPALVICPLAPQVPKNPTASSPHSHDEAFQEFTNLKLTLMIPQAIIHKYINQILLEHRQLLHLIPFVDATHQNEMHREFWEELNTLLGQALEAYPKEDIIRIVSGFLPK